MPANRPPDPLAVARLAALLLDHQADPLPCGHGTPPDVAVACDLVARLGVDDDPAARRAAATALRALTAAVAAAATSRAAVPVAAPV